jgi:hypothetical protein
LILFYTFITTHQVFAIGKLLLLIPGAAFDGHAILSKVADDFWCTPNYVDAGLNKILFRRKYKNGADYGGLAQGLTDGFELP